MHRIKKTFHTIRARILLSTISLILLISIIVTVISYRVVSSNLRKNLIQTSETRLSFLSSSIDDNIDEVMVFIRSIQISSKIKSFAMEDDPSDNKTRREAHDYIMETYTSNSALPSELVRLVVLGKLRDDIVQVVESPNSITGVSAEAILSLPYFNELHSFSGSFSTGIVADPFIKTKQVDMIPFVHPIWHPYKAGEIGYIFTEMSPKVITKPIKNYLSKTDSHLFFQMGDYEYEYSEGNLVPIADYFPIIQDMSALALSNDTKIWRVKNLTGEGTSLLITRPLKHENFYITVCLDEGSLTHSIYKTFFFFVCLILGAAALIGFLLSFFLSKTVNEPVKKLQLRMKRIEQGDFSRDPSTEWDHELGEIGTDINDLSENVRNLMNQRIEDERQKKDYEYKILQSQINPHFLYNTLNSIKWMATIQNAPGIAEMTTALSRLLRDIAKGTSNIVTIAHEISLLNDYFTIQQYRYGGTISLSYEIDDDALLQGSILNFTLQPIVENAIFHGIEPKGSAGTITIHLYTIESGDIQIDVTDDGVGMEPEVASALLQNESPTDSSFFKGIGICNVHKRLQYKFGEGYGLKVFSEPNRYTTISIRLPYQPTDINAMSDQ